MDYANAIVVDKNGCAKEITYGDGFKSRIVLVALQDGAGEAAEIPQNYKLKNGESLVYENLELALAMNAPRWTGTAWEETKGETK